MSKEAFIDQHMMDFRGKDYLPVAPRVVLFRAEKPDWSIINEPVEVAHTNSKGEKVTDVYIRCTVVSPAGKVIQVAHKKVKFEGGKGPAAQWPLETAETGAMGRALAGVGYGTLSGDLDEGDQISDAPVERDLNNARMIEHWKNQIEGAGTLGELEEVRKATRTAPGEVKNAVKPYYESKYKKLSGK